VARIRSGTGVVLVGGPAGIGKSTELARALVPLQSDHVACLVPLDKLRNVRNLDAGLVCAWLMQGLVQAATELKLGLSPEARRLADASYASDGDRGSIDDGASFATSADMALQLVVEEVYRLVRPRRIVFLIDGLEKVLDLPPAMDIFGELSTLPDYVSVVAVVPWQATFGIRGDTLIRPGEWFLPLRAWEVDGDAGEAGRASLLKILLRRLGSTTEAMGQPATADHGAEADATSPDAQISPHERALAITATGWSGGIPRTFLQLMADAGTYARLRGHDGWPEQPDLDNAVADLEDSFRRLLLPGDTAAIRAAVGSDGRELELSRKVRLMAHGILLERVRDRRPILELHPLARRSMESGSQHA
jgi:hypothetical protein